MKKQLKLASAMLAGLMTTVAAADVVTTIRPIGFIVEALASGVTDTKLIVEGNQSPHTFSLTPAKMQQIKEADLFIYVSPDLETTVAKAMLNPNNLPKHYLVLAEIPEIKKLLVKGVHFHPDADPKELEETKKSTRKLKGQYGQTEHHDHKADDEHKADEHKQDHDKNHKHQHAHGNAQDPDHLEYNYHI